jgi:inositol-1,3,4-trisphosphate 5/6-kinase/inositol-tetrakisphosphate 1-kinase
MAIGGVLFKVYIVGDQIRVVRRFSLPDVQEGEDNCSGVIPFPRVSCAAATAEEADLDPQAAGKDPLFTSLLGSICRLSAQSVPD